MTQHCERCDFSCHDYSYMAQHIRDNHTDEPFKGTYQDYKRTGEFKTILTEVESWHMWKYMPLSTVEGHLEGKITDITAVACYIYEAIQRAKKEGTDLVATDKEPK